MNFEESEYEGYVPEEEDFMTQLSSLGLITFAYTAVLVVFTTPTVWRIMGETFTLMRENLSQ